MIKNINNNQNKYLVIMDYIIFFLYIFVLINMNEKMLPYIILFFGIILMTPIMGLYLFIRALKILFENKKNIYNWIPLIIILLTIVMFLIYP